MQPLPGDADGRLSGEERVMLAEATRGCAEREPKSGVRLDRVFVDGDGADELLDGRMS